MSVELEVERTVVLRAKTRGWQSRKAKWQGRRHAPDRFFLKPKYPPTWIEFKRPKNPDDRMLQDREHEFMRSCGCRVFKVYSVEESDVILP